jgi:hypothetical protein
LESLDQDFLLDLSSLYKTITKRGAQVKTFLNKDEVMLEYDYTERYLDHDVLAIIQDNRTSSDSFYEKDVVDSLICVSALRLLKTVEFLQSTKDIKARDMFVAEFYNILKMIDDGIHSFPPCENIFKQLVTSIGYFF